MVMRGAALVVAACLMSGMLASGRASASTADLARQLDQLVGSFPGGAGVWVSDPNVAEPLFTHDAEEQVLTASLYKLGVLAEAERRVDAGELDYRTPIVIQPEDITEDGSFVPAGTRLTLDAALEAMITISDNGPALALWHVLGGANINATLARAGLADFHVQVRVNEDSWATPHAIGTFFTLLAKRQLISPAASDRMLARLGRQQINDRLPAQLPDGVVVAHKTGNLTGVAHDAGIIYTESGPRIVVVMTWDVLDDDAADFISSIGSIVYSAVVEPPANARYKVTKGTVAADVGARTHVIVPITNIGSRAWTAGGSESVGLIWELRDTQGTLLTSSAQPQVLPALAPNQTQNVGIDVLVPEQPGMYRVTLGLTDAAGKGLWSAGAATATFSLRAHDPYLVTARLQIPRLMHRGEASLLIVNYAALAGAVEGPLSLSWRAVEARTNRTAHQGSTPLGALKAGEDGTFFVPFVAPDVLGTYRLFYELSDGNDAVSEPVSATVEIARPRTYPDDEGGRPIPSSQALVAPSPSPRFEFPDITSPKPSLSIPLPLHGKSPSPTPPPQP
jgi:beta-lactamase class A